MKVFTFGYSRQRVDDLDAIRRQLGALIVDIRYSPRSRVPAWNRGPLEQRFGNDYVWIGEFGNVNWKNDGAIELLNPTAGAERLEALVRADRPPILLCTCAEVATCHRSNVAALLAERFGWEIAHLGAPAAPPRSSKAPRAEPAARRANHGLRKVCGCARSQWPKCSHSWFVNYKPRGGPHFRFSLDRYLRKHVQEKREAQKELNRIRSLIDAGTFRLDPEPPPTAATTPAAMTFAAFGATFLERMARHKASAANDESMLERAAAFELPPPAAPGSRLGDKPIGAITEDEIEAFLAHLRGLGRAASTRNQYLALFKMLASWGVRKGFLPRSWIGPASDLRRDKPARRNRRLAPDVYGPDGKLKQAGEERRLLAAAAPSLQRLIIAALETGCRQGELLSLQWKDVDLARGELQLLATKTKDRDFRIVPISARLRAVLDMARHDAAGEEFGPDAYVFGDSIGRRIASPKKAWETCVLRAHGYEVRWAAGGHKLSSESRAALRVIDLHFHDLRHEAGSRFLESGHFRLHDVQELLGHASVKTTGIYLNAVRLNLKAAMQRVDADRSRGTLAIVAIDGAQGTEEVRGRRDRVN